MPERFPPPRSKVERRLAAQRRDRAARRDADPEAELERLLADEERIARLRPRCWWRLAAGLRRLAG